DAPAVPDSSSLLPTVINYPTAFLVTILTLGIPAFYASVTRVTSSTLDLKTAVRVWEAVRNFDSILLAALVAALFKEPIYATYWFFITCSLLQAGMGLICSTILIICFSGDLGHDGYSLEVDKLSFSFWTIWDLFSVPAIWTVWAALTFIVALIIDAGVPNIVQNDCVNGNHDSDFIAARVILYLFICLLTVRFAFFMLHLRRIYQARINPALETTMS
ncbi:hypothetical protein F5887DRAFT_939086, partial [Amanita rubescens]